MKKFLTVLLTITFIFGLAACRKTTDTFEDDMTYAAVDINPTIEFLLDENKIVVNVYYVNSDAEIVAADLDFVGMPLNEALEVYLEAAIKTGYVDVDSHENMITVTSNDSETEAQMKEDVKTTLSAQGVGAAIFGGEMHEDYDALADTHNISVGRARLISRAVEVDANLTFAAALEMSHGEIMAILIEEHEAKMSEFMAERRDAALSMKNNMKALSEVRVEAHYSGVADGTIEAPDYDAIHQAVLADIEAIRARYQERMNEALDNIPAGFSGYSYTSFDINPTIEFVLNKDNLVVSVYYANEDAEIVAADLQLIGMPVNDALEVYLDAAIETGYIDVDSHENMITVSNDKPELEASLRDDLEFLLTERAIGAAIFGGEMHEDYEALAETHNISVGRARLIARAVEIDEDLTFTAALEMSHGKIMKILVDAHNVNMTEFNTERRDAALAMKVDMEALAEVRVEAHRDGVADGSIEAPDYDAIREAVLADIEAIRARYETRIDEARENIPAGVSAYSYASLDINPSIEFILDKDMLVVSVYYANADAEVVAADLELIGMPVDEAFELYLNASIETGYVDVDSHENIITITHENAADQTSLKEDVEAILSERAVGAAIFGGEMHEDYEALAEQYAISVGRARLIARAVEIDADLTFEAALDMSHGKIMVILIDAHEASMEEFIAERRDAALAMKVDMKVLAEVRVEAHRDGVADGSIVAPDYDAIREAVLEDLEAIRDQYESRLPKA